MTNVTEKLLGKNGNGGQYYKDLPKGDEVFDKEPVRRAVRAWFMINVSEDRLTYVQRAISAISLKRRQVARVFLTTPEIISYVKAGVWERVPKDTFLRIEKMLKSGVNWSLKFS